MIKNNVVMGAIAAAFHMPWPYVDQSQWLLLQQIIKVEDVQVLP